MSAQIGHTYEVTIEEEFDNQWTGPQGIARIEGIDVRIPRATVGQAYRVTVTALGTNQWTQRPEATVADVERLGVIAQPEGDALEPTDGDTSSTAVDGWYPVATLDDVTPGTITAVKPGGRLLALVNLDGELYALDSRCPHREGPLAGGRLLGDELTCPWHGFRFDPRTGHVAMPRDGFPPVPTFPVRIVDREIQVSLSTPT